MEVDRYTKFVLTIIALALSTLAFKDIVAPQPAAAAGPTEEVVQLSRTDLRSVLGNCLREAPISLRLLADGELRMSAGRHIYGSISYGGFMYPGPGC